MSDLDAVVIGAGAAGLLAADTLARAGKSVTVLEASTRAGGRIFTDTSAGVAIELGAEFVHGSPRPTLSLAERAGVELIPITGRRYMKRGGKLVEADDAFETFGKVLARVRKDEPDDTARSFVDRLGLDADERERFRQLVEGFEAAPLDEVSIQSLAADAGSASDDESQFRVRGGYRTLIDYLLAGIAEAGGSVRFCARATRVEYRAGGPVAVHLAASESPVLARAVIIAVPLPVLQGTTGDDRLVLEPALTALAPSLDRLAMGHACRVSLRFRDGFGSPHVPAEATFLHEPALAFETFWLGQISGERIWTAWAGGPKAQLLAAESREKREHLAITAFAKLVELDRERVERELLSLHHHDFSNDPLVQGAYSFMRPNGMRAARALTAPIADALFIAGEATDHEFPGTVAGALASGERAAQQVLRALSQ